MTVVFVATGPDYDQDHFLAEVAGLDQAVFIGIDRGVSRLLEAGLPIELAIGDYDSVPLAVQWQAEAVAQHFIRLATDKDQTDTEAAIEWALNHYPDQAYYFYGIFGGRIDHELSNLWLAYQPQLQDKLIDMTFIGLSNRLKFYRPGTYQISPLPDYDYLSFIGLTSIKNLTLTGVKYELDQVDYPYPIALVSNEFISSDQDMRLSFSHGLLMAIQSRDAG
ncbi:hypothetical protein AWM75_02695 [Aerococcus urinaehominis]|uniref:Thiamine diphosphokinase n=1 Tax=Aerococcus urinaehominis TaxID=128944 RepID=A0A0X8FKG6_9LACT|nr:thiamine diphosphokinase [Aerococcus urinaehominis]AMB98970.1 hypothetical protein AWM75_02695 [Aerococcus urinaehominis]SDM37319.1 thiamine pyrophosphokinase [Aerococcus urinaehominis]